MKTHFSRLLPILLLCGFSFSAGHAQPRKVTDFFLFLAKSSPQYSRVLMQEEAARRALQAAQTAAAAPLAQAEKQLAAPSNFATRHKRLLWELQTRAGISKRQALLNLQKWGARPGLSKYPPLEKESFFLRDFSGLPPAPSGDIPAPPFYARDGYVFCGMNLGADGADLRRILRRGFLPPETARIPRAAVDASPLSALRSALNGRTPHSVTVLFSVRNAPLSGHTALATETSAGQIAGAAVLLQKDGRLRWYRAAAQEDGFSLTPYAVRPLP